MYQLMPDIFAIPNNEKDEINMRHSPSFLGYTTLGAETTAAATDLREVELHPKRLPCA